MRTSNRDAALLLDKDSDEEVEEEDGDGGGDEEAQFEAGVIDAHRRTVVPGQAAAVIGSSLCSPAAVGAALLHIHCGGARRRILVPTGRLILPA